MWKSYACKFDRLSKGPSGHHFGPFWRTELFPLWALKYGYKSFIPSFPFGPFSPLFLSVFTTWDAASKSISRILGHHGHHVKITGMFEWNWRLRGWLLEVAWLTIEGLVGLQQTYFCFPIYFHSWSIAAGPGGGCPLFSVPSRAWNVGSFP